MTRFRYITKHLWESLHTSALALLMSLVALGFCFLLLGVCGFALARQEALVPDWLASNSIVAYLEANASQPDLDRMVREVSTWPEVELVQQVSRKQAHERLKLMLGHWKGVLDGLEEEFLPPSLQIRMKPGTVQAGAAEEVVARLRRLPLVAEIQYGKEHWEWLQSLAEQWTSVWMILGLLLVLVAVLIISNAVRLVVAHRKTEVHVYRLVGAMPYVVKLPYYVEGILLGSAGAFLATGVLALLGVQVHRMLPAFWGAALGWTSWESAALLAGLVGCGAACGWLGSWMGLGKSL
ncbi:MAG: cell division protein FtsX [Syntrophobacteraceae bacterium]